MAGASMTVNWGVDYNDFVRRIYAVVKFAYKSEKRSTKKGKRQYLKNDLANEFTNKLNNYFLSKVNIPRMKVGSKQEIETLINEEALLFAKYLREEVEAWNPRIVDL